MVKNISLDNVKDDDIDKEVTIEEEVTEEIDLGQQLEKERAMAAEYLDGWQRARAELANARKRWERESNQTYSNAISDLVSKLVPVLDDFERALETLPETQDEQSWVDGIWMIYRKLQTFLEQQGVTSIEAGAGLPFDPAYHQAVTHEPHKDFEADTIIAEFQKGYKLGERIVRPAMVRVSSGPPEINSASAENVE